MNCETCGKILKGKQTKFCSKSCKNKANRKNHMKTQEGLEYIISKLKLGYELFPLGITDNNLVGLNLFNWKVNKKQYVLTNPEYGNVYLHRVIWTFFYGEIPKDKQIDHINRDKLDNRLCNLRLANNSQNVVNRSQTKTKVNSKYKGVHKTASGKWQAQIWYNNKNYALGSFDTEEEAALAYNQKAREMQG